MRNKRLIIALLGALVFGLVAAVSISRLLSNAQAFTKSLTRVAIAKIDIPLGTRITAEQITVGDFPNGVVPEGAFKSPKDLVGRIAIVNIKAREAITTAKLAPEGSEAGLSAIIPEGYRAITVKVDEVVGVSGFLMPGTLVDVVVVIDPPESTNNKDKVSKVVLQNIKVLANGQNLDKPKSDREAEKVKSVTLLVTPEQAEKLALAATEGKLQLTMRNAVDQSDEPTPGANKTTLLSGEPARIVPNPAQTKTEPKPAPQRIVRRPIVKPAKATFNLAPPPRPSVEMIEGTKKRTVDFP